MKTILYICVIAVFIASFVIIGSNVHSASRGDLVPILDEKLPAQKKADLVALLKAMRVYYSFSGNALLVEKYHSEALTEKLRSGGFLTKHMMPSLKDIECCPACKADRALLMLCSNEKSCSDSILEIDGVRDCYIRFLSGKSNQKGDDGRWNRVFAVLYLSKKLSSQALQGLCSVLSYSFEVPFGDIILSDERGRLLIPEQSGSTRIDGISSRALWDSVPAAFKDDTWLTICRVSKKKGITPREIFIFARNERDLERKDEIQKLTLRNLSQNGIDFSEKSDIFSVDILDRLKDCLVR